MTKDEIDDTETINARIDARLETLRLRHGVRVGGAEYNGHFLAFKKPSRENIRDYRRKVDSPVEKVDAMDQLAQVTIVAFDDQEDPNLARTMFTTVFLEAYPMAMSTPRLAGCLSPLAGLLEVEDEKDLGKGVRIKGSPPPVSPKV